MPGTIALLLLTAACGRVEALSSPELLADRPINVVATTGMVAEAVAEVGGERVRVSALMGPGIDPHAYKASERDVIRIAEADVIFLNGLHLEAKMGDIFEKIGRRVRSVAVAEAIPASELLSPPGFEGSHDPHVWFDVRLWQRAVSAIRDALIELDPASSEIYSANADAYLERLAELHDYVLTRAQTVPPERRVLITAHDAFTYFGRAYGFEVMALQGISTVAEAGTADIKELAELVVEREIPAIFIETSVPTRFIQAVQEAVRSRSFNVEVGGELYSDALGDPGSPQGTFEGIVRHNIDTIVEALR